MNTGQLKQAINALQPFAEAYEKYSGDRMLTHFRDNCRAGSLSTGDRKIANLLVLQL